MKHIDSGDVFQLLALARCLEDEGQYNLAKLIRARADSISRRAAWNLGSPGDHEALTDAIERVAVSLGSAEADLAAALRQGASAMAGGRLPLIQETPHPYVCRTCGQLALGGAIGKCPTCGAWGGTFQWFPPVYWLEALDPRAALERLRRTPQEVAALLEGLSEEAMTWLPPDGGWAIRNTVMHLRDAQGVIASRLAQLLAEKDPILEVKAVFSWALNEAAQPPSTREAFETYASSRLKMIAQLEAVPMEDWWRTGRHEEFGVVSVKQQVSYFALHELTHLPQIERLVRQT
jgi:uncharacterized damage-inducible protein DinB